jgi:hypothetical protein
MASGFKIEEQDRVPYEASVNDPEISAEERELRAAIVKWAKIQQPNGGEWIYAWPRWGE